MAHLNELTIDNDFLIANITVTLPDKSTLVCNVPVKFPKTKEDVLAAIKSRETAEILKATAAPVLKAIKTEMDALYTGKAIESETKA